MGRRGRGHFHTPTRRERPLLPVPDARARHLKVREPRRTRSLSATPLRRAPRSADLELEQLRIKTDRLLAILMLVLIPVSAFLILSGRPLLALIYMRGEFDLESLGLTARGLYGLSVGLWAVGGCYFLRNVLSSRLRNSEVLRGEAIGIVISLIIILSGYRSLGILALGLGPSVGAVGALVYYFRRLGFETPSLWRIARTLAVALPPYVAGAWFVQHQVGGLAGLGLQVLFMTLYWGIIFLRYSPVRRLLAGGGSMNE